MSTVSPTDPIDSGLDDSNSADGGRLDRHSAARRIAYAMDADQGRFRRRLKRLKHAGLHSEAWLRLTAELDASVARRKRRQATPIQPDYPADLPITRARSDLLSAISRHQVVVVCGATGSGKTTQLPKMCLELGRGTSAVIGHTQPRRVAARRVAARIAEELGPEHACAVGYQVRFNSTVSDDCRIKVMTDGILLAEVQTDRRLNRYDTIVLDEAHERSLNIDFLLGYLKYLLPRRPELKVLISSATIDAERFSQFFDQAPVIEVSGRMFPVEIRYQCAGDQAADDAEPAVEAVGQLWREEAGDILVFLPGERQIRSLATRLRGSLPGEAEILPLYARLPAADQDKVFSPVAGPQGQSARRRVVLATNVAETSLTVPGVRHVVDTGLARISRYAHGSTVQSLPIEPISRAAADQRSGRAGRLGPGICVRLYSEADFLSRPEFTEPEITRSNLAAVLLRLLALGWADVEAFPFFDPPVRRHVNDAYRLLRELGALEADDRLSADGHRLARLPLDPRVGTMLLQANELGCLREVLIIASGLAIADVRERTSGAKEDAAERVHEQFRDSRSDFMAMLRLWRYFERGGHSRSSVRAGLRSNDEGRFRSQCRRLRISASRLREWQDVHAQLTDVANDVGLRLNKHPGGYARIHRSLLAGLLRNVGNRTGPREYTGVRDAVFLVSPSSFQYASGHAWVVAGELVQTSKLYAYRIASVRPEWIESHAQALVRRGHFEAYWDADQAQAMVFEQVTLYGLVLVPRRRVRYAPVSRADARDIFIRAGLVEGGYRTSAKFLANNADVVNRLREFDHKLRRPDVLTNDERLYQFYDRLIPLDICDAASFEAWRRSVERINPTPLFADAADLCAGEVSPALAFEYPDIIEVSGIELSVKYRFAPQDDDDGITVQVPANVMGEVDSGAFEWLVPGMLADKVGALLRALPKSIRRAVVPLPDCVGAFVKASTAQFAVAGGRWPPAGSLRRALVEFIAESRGATVPLEHWRSDRLATELPPYLLMRFAVVDPHGVTLDAGRSLPELQRRFRNAPGRLDTPSAQPGRRPQERFRDWDFGELPESAEVERNGLPVLVFPALQDRSDSVQLGATESPQAAVRQTRQGLRRLFVLRIRRRLAELLREQGGFDASRLAYLLVPENPELPPWRHWEEPSGSLEPSADRRSVEGASRTGGDRSSRREPLSGLDREVAEMVADRHFVADRPLPRTKEAFESRLAAGQDTLPEVVRECAELVGQCLTGYRQVMANLESEGITLNTGTRHDLSRQLKHLFYQGFVANTPFDRLQAYPRYLEAIARRMDKVRRGGARDQAKIEQLEPYWVRYHDRAISHRERGRHDPALVEYRWMLEEFRISLFCQELGTAYPISPERLERQWQRVSA